MAIYTKKGDKGDTGLLGGGRIAKDDLRVTCYGTLDEANAAIGLAYSLVKDGAIQEILQGMQKQLFMVGAELASDEKGQAFLKDPIGSADISALERMIDRYERELGALKEFIIPGETTASAAIHLARTIIRRAERLIVELSKRVALRPEIIQFTNRLSDALFTLARAEVRSSLVEEVKDQIMQRLAAPCQAIKLDLFLAGKLAAKAEEMAAKLGVPIVFTAVDPGGNLILLHRMEGSLLASLEVATNKAYTAVALKMATHELAPLLQPGADLYGLQSSVSPRIVSFGGGYPLFVNQELLGGIGVSGGTVEQDMIIAAHVIQEFDSERVNQS